MAIPTPEPGLVISYSYLWDREAVGGQDEGLKDRPCVITLAVERDPGGETIVVVLPVTHRAPANATAAMEIPAAIKRHLGLDSDRSWIILDEGDQFVWPGYDLRRVRGSNRYHYGFLPPRFLASVLSAFRNWHRTNRVRLTARD